MKIFEMKMDLGWGAGKSIAVISAFAVALGICEFGYGQERPNIVLIMSDDQGWGDAGYMGHPNAVTPALDDMAAKGLVFNRFYAAAPVCSPTRGSVLTGRHPFRYGIYNANTGHLPEEEPNLARILKAEGYRTGHFGKWHLGTLTTRVEEGNRARPGDETHYAPPWERGFDVAFSTESKVPTYNPLWRPRDFSDHPGNLRHWWDPVIDPGNVMPYGTGYWNEHGEAVTWNMEGPNAEVMMNRTLRFVDDSVERDEPFFAVVWFHEPHLPVVAGESDREPFSELDPYDQHYWGCMKAMDREIGRLREHLRALDIHENTMVWFTSDNGPEGNATAPGSAGGLRGRKRDLYEGGIRVPGIVEWPGTIQPGETDFVAVTSDYLPTLVDLLGIELGGGHEFDGVSLKPLFKDPTLEREEPIGFMSQGRIAWIGQRFKVIDHQRGGGTWAEPPWNLELYDLVADPAESKDLAAEKPELLDEKEKGLRTWYEAVGKDARN
jgi:arylsulfatase A-like enzyme